MGDLASDLETEARTRFVRFDSKLWRALVLGPTRALAEKLVAAGTPEHDAQRLLESYLRLGCEAIGLGYLFPESVGRSFFTLAWNRLIPTSLAELPPERRAAALAECWNLGENLEQSPLWLRRIALRFAERLPSLQALPTLVGDVAKTLAEPDRKLGDAPRIEWVLLAEEDPRFLPGRVQFVAPTVVVVHDRHRTAEDGGEAVTTGVWLADPPQPLGSMGAFPSPPPASDRSDLLDYVAAKDPRTSDIRESAVNEWRGALTLETSQFLIALLPA